ncbi:hypothetical protein FOA52_003939 [Chlamydomonas sp. UWO 241]|nr:hypothetical protein FOA52_003939 [Chlamydomonas sp. UWO 241]
MSDNGSEEEQFDLSNSDVVTKYKAAADIANKAIAEVLAGVKVGAKVVDLCAAGDAVINAECKLIFKNKNLGPDAKGVAFPTCISINSVVGHFCPLADDATVLAEGDLIKIDLGVHIEGFIATQATTQVVTSGAVNGKQADLIAATRTCFDAALRLIRPGKKVAEVAPVLHKIAEAYGCSLVEGVMSHEMKRYIIDGNKCVLNRPTPEQKVEDVEFEENEVYAIDIVLSTGEGKPKIQDEKATTVYKRALDQEYNLKACAHTRTHTRTHAPTHPQLKASRAVFSEVNKNYPAMPFTLRALVEGAKDKDMGKQMRLGLVECLNHGLLHPYPVLHEKSTELVAQVKGTVLLMPNGSDLVTKAPVQEVTSEKKCDDADVLALLLTSIKISKKKSKKDKKEVVA